MKILLIFVLLLFTLSSPASCDDKAIDFCAAANESGSRIASSINYYFNNDNQQDDVELRLQKFKEYLFSQSCVAEILIEEGYLRTAPPQKVVYVTFGPNVGPTVKQILLSIDDQRITATIKPN